MRIRILHYDDIEDDTPHAEIFVEHDAYFSQRRGRGRVFNSTPQPRRA
jgi:hypothetical protein